jgi:hypothetical protein
MLAYFKNLVDSIEKKLVESFDKDEQAQNQEDLKTLEKYPTTQSAKQFKLTHSLIFKPNQSK